MYKRVIKRGLDFALALIGLTIAAIPMGMVAIAIKIESKGPVIFKQDRIGYKGKVYKMYKFRSMCVGAEKGGFILINLILELRGLENLFEQPVLMNSPNLLMY